MFAIITPDELPPHASSRARSASARSGNFSIAHWSMNTPSASLLPLVNSRGLPRSRPARHVSKIRVIAARVVRCMASRPRFTLPRPP